LSWDRSNLKEHVSFLSFSTHRTKKPGLATDDKKKEPRPAVGEGSIKANKEKRK
jgi:hypothetical protein